MATYRVKHAGNEYEVIVVDTASGGAKVTVEGRTFDVEPTGATAPAAAPAARPTVAAPTAVAAAPTLPPAAAAPVTGGSGSIQAPIPGVITQVCVKVGAAVSAGDTVVKLEAMKMENDISTPVGGTVQEIAVSEGTEVSDGQLLAVIG